MRPCVNCSTAPAILRHALRWGVRAPLDLAMEVLVEAFDHLTPAEVRQLPVELAVALFAHAAAVGTKGSARRAHMACDAIRDELQARCRTCAGVLGRGWSSCFRADYCAG